MAMLLRSCVYSLKTLLEWKRPVYSGAFIIFCNFMFWNIVNCSCRSITIWSLTFLSLVAFDFILSSVWPTIKNIKSNIKASIQYVNVKSKTVWNYFKRAKKVSEAEETSPADGTSNIRENDRIDGEEEEEDDMWQQAYEFVDNILEYRELNPEKFLIKTLFICVCTGIIGCYVSGVVLVYSLFVGVQLMFLTNQCGIFLKCIYKRIRNVCDSLMGAIQAPFSKLMTKAVDGDDNDSDYGDLMLAEDAFNQPLSSTEEEEESSAGLPIPSRPPSSINDLSDRESVHSIPSDMEFPSFHDPNFDPSSLTLNESMMLDVAVTSLASIRSNESAVSRPVSKRTERFSNIDLQSSDDDDDLLPCPSGEFPSLDAVDSRRQLTNPARRRVQTRSRTDTTYAQQSHDGRQSDHEPATRGRRSRPHRSTPQPPPSNDEQITGLFGQLLSNVVTNYLSSTVRHSYTNLSSYMSSYISTPAPRQTQVTLIELPPDGTDHPESESDIAEFELVNNEDLPSLSPR